MILLLCLAILFSLLLRLSVLQTDCLLLCSMSAPACSFLGFTKNSQPSMSKPLVHWLLTCSPGIIMIWFHIFDSGKILPTAAPPEHNGIWFLPLQPAYSLDHPHPIYNFYPETVPSRLPVLPSDKILLCWKAVYLREPSICYWRSPGHIQGFPIHRKLQGHSPSPGIHLSRNCHHCGA